MLIDGCDGDCDEPFGIIDLFLSFFSVPEFEEPEEGNYSAIATFNRGREAYDAFIDGLKEIVEI